LILDAPSSGSTRALPERPVRKNDPTVGPPARLDDSDEALQISSESSVELVGLDDDELAPTAAEMSAVGEALEADSSFTDMVVPFETAESEPAAGALPSERSTQRFAVPDAPTELGPWRLVRALGEGSMARVFLGRAPDGREAAVKVLLAELSAQARGRLRREARILQRIAHPHVLRCLGHGTGEALPWVALEHVPGEDLETCLRRVGRLEPATGLRVLLAVASGLHGAHRAGVVHRDLKASNVLLGEGGALKVADFGLARRAEESLAITAPGRMLGTPIYMAPELLTGAEADARSDVYAFGVLAYEVLTGEPPFAGKHVDAVFFQHLQVEPPTLAERGVDLPAATASALQACLWKDPDERPGVERLIAALELATTGRVSSRVRALEPEAGRARSGSTRAEAAERPRSGATRARAVERPRSGASRAKAERTRSGSTRARAERTRSGRAPRARKTSSRLGRVRAPSSRVAALRPSSSRIRRSTLAGAARRQGGAPASRRLARLPSSRVHVHAARDDSASAAFDVAAAAVVAVGLGAVVLTGLPGALPLGFLATVLLGWRLLARLDRSPTPAPRRRVGRGSRTGQVVGAAERPDEPTAPGPAEAPTSHRTQVIPELARAPEGEAPSRTSLTPVGGGLPTAPEQLVGARLGRYALAEYLGEGAFAWVYRAHHDLLDRPTAVKVLKPHLAQGEAARRFVREGRALAEVRDPHLIRVFDAGATTRGLHFLALEYVDGPTVERLIERHGALPVHTAARLATGVLGALASAHEQGVVHRDLKPANVLVADGKRAKVVDFGIAALVDRDASAEGKGLLATPAYASPEQARGEPAGAASDQYQAALILYELLTGQLPFQAGHAYGYLGQHAHRAPRHVRQLRPAVPRALAAAVMRALAKDPAERFPSARAFARVVARFVD